MALYTALSGLNAAQTDISVTSNNIANVGTIGFHGSRAEFADIYTNSPYSRPASQVGKGVETARIGVDFSQGSMRATGNVFDLSLQGPGFFQVQTSLDEDAQLAYTRAGAFGVNVDGYVTNAAGHYLSVFPTAADGSRLGNLETELLQIPQQNGTPSATAAVDLAVQLSLTDNGALGSQAAVPAAVFDPADPSTFAYSTSVPVLNEAGDSVPAQAYFVLADAPDAADPSISYSVQFVVDGEIAVPTDPAATLSFDGDGVQTGGLADMEFTLATGPVNINLANSGVSQEPFEVLSVSHDGTALQNLTALEVGPDGNVWATYGSDPAISLGQVAVGTFNDLQGLTSIGSATYLESRVSGPVRLGGAGESGFGQIRSGTIEQANVDLTEELVNLIMAQRNYQASAKALETNGKMSETVMNIRS
jgi:flagellar hook protein FlgE